MPFDLSTWGPVALGVLNLLAQLRLQVTMLKHDRKVKRLFLGHLQEHHGLKVASLMDDGDNDD